MPMAANIIQTMKQAVKAQVLANSTLHALAGTGAKEADAEGAGGGVMGAMDGWLSIALKLSTTGSGLTIRQKNQRRMVKELFRIVPSDYLVTRNGTRKNPHVQKTCGF
jgi:hypothetical protein